MPADLQMVTFILCIHQRHIAAAGAVFEGIAVVRDACDTADVAGGADDVDVGGDVLHDVIPLTHEANQTADISSPILRVSLDIAALVRVNRDIGQVRVGVLSERAADVGTTVYGDLTAQNNVGILGGVGRTRDRADTR